MGGGCISMGKFLRRDPDGYANSRLTPQIRVAPLGESVVISGHLDELSSSWS